MKKATVMFWHYDTAILFGTQSQFYFDDRQSAFNFISNMTVEGCTEVSVDNDVYPVLED